MFNGIEFNGLDIRTQFLNDLGAKTMQLYEGNFDNVLYSANGSAMSVSFSQLLDIITSTFDTFKD